VTSGHLNIAALGLNQLPDEILSMYDISDNSTISWSEAVDLTKLNAADNEFEQLPDRFFPDWTRDEMMEDEEKSNQFAGLELLDLRRNMLVSLPLGLRRLDCLRVLDLSNNKLVMEALHVLFEIQNLQELVLAGNALSGSFTPAIQQLKQLQVLDLHGNQLDGLPDTLSELKDLRKLNIAGNKIATLPMQALSGLPLVEINASKNKLSGLLYNQDITEFKKLRTLNLSYNSIDQFSEHNMALPCLQLLMLDGNRLLALPNMLAWTCLHTLTASENNLTGLPSYFAEMESLQSVDFSHNSIKVVDPKIARMESLSVLNLQGNPLRERKYLTMSTQDMKMDLGKRNAPEETLAERTTLTLAMNDDTQDNTTPNLHKPHNGILDLSSQSLTTITPDLISFTSSIHTLNLSNNDLSSFPSDLLAHPSVKSSLRTLNLSHNPLAPISYLSCPLFLPTLVRLDIVSTGLASLDALTIHLSAPKLRELNISCHRLAGHVPWVRACWPSITTLLATDNWFSSIDLEAVRGLEVLDIRNNEIESLPPKIGFLGTRTKDVEKGKLKSLEVSGNRFRVPRISIVEKGTEAVLKELRRMTPLEEVPEEWKGDV